MKKYVLIGVLVLFGLLPAAYAQTRYSRDSSGDAVWRDNYGNSWRSSQELSGEKVWRDDNGNSWRFRRGLGGDTLLQDFIGNP